MEKCLRQGDWVTKECDECWMGYRWLRMSWRFPEDFLKIWSCSFVVFQCSQLSEEAFLVVAVGDLPGLEVDFALKEQMPHLPHVSCLGLEEIKRCWPQSSPCKETAESPQTSLQKRWITDEWTILKHFETQSKHLRLLVHPMRILCVKQFGTMNTSGWPYRKMWPLMLRAQATLQRRCFRCYFCAWAGEMPWCSFSWDWLTDQCKFQPLEKPVKQWTSVR